MAAARAWPYAVTRGATSGYQAIVAPAFLTQAGQAYVLEYASRQETSEPGAVTVRDVVGATEEPLSLAYRVLEVRADRYALGGTDPLEDSAGRAIRVFEGLVLRLPAERVPSIGLTAADLDAVTAATAPAFRKLWAAGSRIEPEASPALSVGGAARESPLSVRISVPYVVPGISAERGPARPGRTRPTAERGPAPRGRTRLTIAVAAACVLAALLAWFLIKSSPASPEAIVQQMCSELSSGDVNAAYQQFSPAYRNATSQQAFQTTLLGSNAKASCTPTMTAADRATVSLRWADGTVRNAVLDLQQEAGRWQITSMNVSP